MAKTRMPSKAGTQPPTQKSFRIRREGRNEESGQGSQPGTLKGFYEIAPVINVLGEVENSIVNGLFASFEGESRSGRSLQ